MVVSYFFIRPCMCFASWASVSDQGPYLSIRVRNFKLGRFELQFQGRAWEATMSKKKVASRSTMTLKDFHGGSIPSDLPLPSAPGMTVDRSTYERQGSGTWMSPTLGRGYGGDRGGYTRQGSSNTVRTFEDKASYFPNPANIGRNYDEDERKPVDGRPRSSHSADRFDDHGYEERRGGFSMDRYSLEEQGSFASAAGSYVEARSLGSSDRFPPSQVVGGGFESDNYVHDEFGLIPVGPLPARVSGEIQPKQQSSNQRELIQTPPEQHTYGQSPPASSLPPYAPQQQSASSPPRSWKNPAHQQAPAPVVTRSQQESVTNVWTARREGEFNRAPTTDGASETIASAPWRPPSSAAKLSEASAVDKVSSGRWQSDAMRPSGRTAGSVVTPGGRSEEINSQNMYGTDADQSPYSGEVGHGTQTSDATQGAYDETGRVGPVGVKRTTYSQTGRGVNVDAGKGDALDRVGYVDDRAAGRSSFSDAGVRSGYAPDTSRRSYSEERWSSTGSYSETERGGNAEIERIAYPETGRGGYSDPGVPKSESNRVPYVEGGRSVHVESGSVDVSEQSRPGYFEVSRYGFGSSGRGGSQYESGHSAYSDRSRCPDEGEGPFSADSGQVMYTENGRSSYVAESGTNTYSREDALGEYGSDGNRASYGDRERSRSPYTVDRAGSVSPDIARPPVPEVWRPGYSAPSPADPSRTAQGTKPEPAERPKLKLLPRSKPLERETLNPPSEDAGGSEKGVEARYIEEKRPAEILSVESERSAANELGANNAMSEVNDESSRKVERPKLNLKPRTQPTEVEPVEGSQKVRQVVFGGARPRELVLKERGVDDSLATSEAGQTPSTGSLPSSTSNASKSERADVVRVDRQESWGEEKQESRRHERPERGFERQVGKEGSRGEREFERKGIRRDQERIESRRNLERYENRREPERTDPRRDGDDRRDIDKQDSWRRPAESPVVSSVGPRNPSSTVSSLVDPTPRSLNAGKYGYTAPASAAELAQAFSRSSSIGSTMTGAARGANSLRSPLSPIPKTSGHGFGPGYGNGLPSTYGPRDAPFSRLAEAPSSVGGREMFQGGGFGGDGLTNGYGSGKLGAYGGGDSKNSFARSELASGRERDEYDDFPGKRGLPIRQKEGYYD